MSGDRRIHTRVNKAIDDALQRIHGLPPAAMRVINDTIKEHIEDAFIANDEEMNITELSGPSLWDYLHWMGRTADEESDPSIYWNAIYTLSKGHPCAAVCRPHIQPNAQAINKYNGYFEHSVALHNLVNKQLGKPQYPLDKAKYRYRVKCSTCSFKYN